MYGVGERTRVDGPASVLYSFERAWCVPYGSNLSAGTSPVLVEPAPGWCDGRVFCGGMSMSLWMDKTQEITS